MHAALIALAATLLVGEVSSRGVEAPVGSMMLPNCLVTLIDENEVPAQEAGVLMDVMVVEGQHVKEGDLLARIDDKQALAAAEVAQYKVEAAKEEAGNDVNRRYAIAAAAVAKSDVESAVAANRQAPGTVPQTELNRYLLQQRQFELQIEQAEYELGIAKTTVKVREAELKATQEDVAHRQIGASFDGVVEELYHRKGEWVQPGEPVLKLIRVDSLWVEAFVDASRYTPGNVRGQPVVVNVTLPNNRQEQFQGQVVFASQKIVQGPQFLIKAEVKNRQDPHTGDWLLRSGMTPVMTVQLR